MNVKLLDQGPQPLFPPVRVVLEWCYSGVIVVLQWCYSGVTVVLQWCYSGVTVVLVGRCRGSYLCARPALEVV